jgi:hypothetical protein
MGYTHTHTHTHTNTHTYTHTNTHRHTRWRLLGPSPREREREKKNGVCVGERERAGAHQGAAPVYVCVVQYTYMKCHVRICSAMAEVPHQALLTSLPTSILPPSQHRLLAKWGHLERFRGLSPVSQGQNLALTVLYVPKSLDRGSRRLPACLSFSPPTGFGEREREAR